MNGGLLEVGIQRHGEVSLREQLRREPSEIGKIEGKSAGQLLLKGQVEGVGIRSLDLTVQAPSNGFAAGCRVAGKRLRIIRGGSRNEDGPPTVVYRGDDVQARDAGRALNRFRRSRVGNTRGQAE